MEQVPLKAPAGDTLHHPEFASRRDSGWAAVGGYGAQGSIGHVTLSQCSMLLVDTGGPGAEVAACSGGARFCQQVW